MLTAPMVDDALSICRTNFNQLDPSYLPMTAALLGSSRSVITYSSERFAAFCEAADFTLNRKVAVCAASAAFAGKSTLAVEKLYASGVDEATLPAVTASFPERRAPMFCDALETMTGDCTSVSMV